MSIAKTKQCPYYAVIFTSVREEHDDAYSKMAEAMFAAAKLQPGYLGVESAGGDIGVTVSYWESLQAIAEWKQQAKHLTAQRLGREKWYRAYKVRICKVERDYEFFRDS